MSERWQDATLRARTHWAPGLASLVFDAAVAPHRAGQYVCVALPGGEDSSDRSGAFSLVSAPGAPAELLVAAGGDGSVAEPLLALAPGASIRLERAASGTLTVSDVPSAAGVTLWLVATGTGVAPFVSILRDGAVFSAFRRVVLAHGVRRRSDWAYADELDALAAGSSGAFVRVPLVSREPAPAGVLAGRVTAALADGRLESAASTALQAGTAHVMLCGSPAMVRDMTIQLQARGLGLRTLGAPGDITTEYFG